MRNLSGESKADIDRILEEFKKAKMVKIIKIIIFIDMMIIMSCHDMTWSSKNTEKTQNKIVMVISNSHDFPDQCAHSHLYIYRHDNHENQDNHDRLDSQ